MSAIIIISGVAVIMIGCFVFQMKRKQLSNRIKTEEAPADAQVERFEE